MKIFQYPTLTSTVAIAERSLILTQPSPRLAEHDQLALATPHERNTIRLHRRVDITLDRNFLPVRIQGQVFRPVENPDVVELLAWTSTAAHDQHTLFVKCDLSVAISWLWPKTVNTPSLNIFIIATRPCGRTTLFYVQPLVSGQIEAVHRVGLVSQAGVAATE